jgi:hypothetical protein
VGTPSHPSLHAGPISGPCMEPLPGHPTGPSEGPTAWADAEACSADPPKGPIALTHRRAHRTGLSRGVHRTAPTAQIRTDCPRPSAATSSRRVHRGPRSLSLPKPPNPPTPSSTRTRRTPTLRPDPAPRSCLGGRCEARVRPRHPLHQGTAREAPLYEAHFLSPALPKWHRARPRRGMLRVASGPIVTQISGH